MMKKTILASMFALSMFGAAVFAHGGAEESKANAAAAETKTTTTVVVEPQDKTPDPLGLKYSKHIASHVPQGGTPKSSQTAVGVVKN